MKINKNLGMLLLGAWLILTGALPLLNISFSGQPLLMQALAIVAGVMIVAGK
jgi:hypothetical protein